MPQGLIVRDVIAITGHRDYPDRASLFRGLDQLRAKRYLFGGARGVDSDALEYIARTQPATTRTVVVPNRLIDQPKLTIPITNKYSTSVIELGNFGPGRFMTRNKYLVDNSDHVRAFYDFRGKGGTFNTIEYSKLSGKPFSIQPMISQDLNKYLPMSEPEMWDFINRAQTNNVPLPNVKIIIMGYFNQRVGYIPANVIARFQNW